MTTEIVIGRMRLTFVWFQPVLDHWRDASPLQPSMSFMADIGEFAKKLGSLTTSPDQDGWTVPWPRSKGHHIWEHYLEMEEYGKANVNVLGKHLVPLRAKPWFSVQAGWLPGYISPEVYFFPFGTAFLLTATYPEKPISFKEGVSLAYDLQHNKKNDSHHGIQLQL